MNKIAFDHEPTRRLMKVGRRINLIDATTGEIAEEGVSVYSWNFDEEGGFINIERPGEIGVFKYNIPTFVVEKWEAPEPELEDWERDDFNSDVEADADDPIFASAGWNTLMKIMAKIDAKKSL
jgi:hypothetical protein